MKLPAGLDIVIEGLKEANHEDAIKLYNMAGIWEINNGKEWASSTLPIKHKWKNRPMGYDKVKKVLEILLKRNDLQPDERKEIKKTLSLWVKKEERLRNYYYVDAIPINQ